MTPSSASVYILNVTPTRSQSLARTRLKYRNRPLCLKFKLRINCIKFSIENKQTNKLKICSLPLPFLVFSPALLHASPHSFNRTRFLMTLFKNPNYFKNNIFFFFTISKKKKKQVLLTFTPNYCSIVHEILIVFDCSAIAAHQNFPLSMSFSSKHNSNGWKENKIYIYKMK